MKKYIIIIMLFIIAAAAVSCGKKSAKEYTFKYQTDSEIKKLLGVMPEYPAVKFAVFSDPHYHDASLGSSGAAFEDYLDDDRKLLHLSGEILDETIKQIAAARPDFILIPGDLTKDGEKINHERFVKKISPLSAVTKKIFVVPGNHDVLNGDARRYAGMKAERVDSVTPDEFKKIYSDYGYAAPLAADKNSLSYIVEPVKGLQVLALDSCLWRKNIPGGHYVTDGEFTEETMRWIEDALIRSKIEKKALIAFMHHGAVEHYPYNEEYYGEYVVNHSAQVSALFAAYGVKLVFTGHFHAQDITLKKGDAPGQFMYDIETGSLVTYPSPYRLITVDKNQKARIESRLVASIASKQAGFKEYSYDFVFKGTVKLAEDALRGYYVSDNDMRLLCPEIARAYITHLSGDEIKPQKELVYEGLGLLGKLVLKLKGDLINGWYTDLPPVDNNILIDLKSGEWKTSTGI